MEENKLKLNAFTVLMIPVLLAGLTAAASPLAAEPDVIRVPEDYVQIQQAIDSANPGDIIHVAAGTYSENLRIRKPLKLVGEGSDKTVVNQTRTVVSVESDNVEISGFSVQDGTYGIFLWYCSGTVLRDNNMSGNTWNFGVWGDSISQFVHDIDSSNLADGKPIYFWVNQHGKHVPKDAGYVALINSTNITIKNMNLTSNEQGVLLIQTNDSIIENVAVSGNDGGIDLRWSHNNTIRRNHVARTRWRAVYLQDSSNNTFCANTLLNNTYGVSIQNSSGNTFYHNNFINNNDQLYVEISQNIWTNEAEEGNYWSDYTGEDVDGDGLGDTDLPWQNVDYHPLINIYEEASKSSLPLEWWIPVVGFGAAVLIIAVGLWRYTRSRK
jgi:nitrous oxidase accessory protein